MEIFLVMNGMELGASVGEQEQFMRALACGDVSREALEWLRTHAVQLDTGS